VTLLFVAALAILGFLWFAAREVISARGVVTESSSDRARCLQSLLSKEPCLIELILSKERENKNADAPNSRFRHERAHAGTSQSKSPDEVPRDVDRAS
jgi:hypothetical protein